MKNNFYSDKSVLITGLSGFVGSWMGIVLTRMCSHVFGIGSGKYRNSTLFKEYGLEKNVTFIELDIYDYDKLNSFIEKNNIDIIIHLAAESEIQSSEEKIEDSINTNFYGTLNILKSFKINTNISHLLIITTDKVYCEDIGYEHHYTENDKLGGNNVYSCGKVLSEKIISFYKEEHLKNRNVLVARPGNILGGLDFSQNRIIPNIMRNIFEGERLHINNSLTKKTFVHILDLISGLLMFIYSKDKGNIHQDILNFGINGNELLTLDEILNIYKERISQDTVFHKGNNDTFVLDSSLANGLLGWKTNYNIEKSLLESFYLYEIFYSSGNIFEEVNLIVDNYFKINKFSFYGPNNNSL